MTIKEIKTKYADYHKTVGDNKTMFTTFCDEYGEKFVVIVTYAKYFGRTVWQAVRVSDGKEMLTGCRPCDNLEDAIDVACEMDWI